MKGLIFSIKKYSINDGPGIRVTFFMKGCPLSCMWCHNPEGISPVPEKIVRINRIGDKEFRSDEEVGRYYDLGELLQIAERDRVFMTQSGGGVTFSGGEPMMQADFLKDALRMFSDNGYNTAVDTSGFSAPENFLAIMPYTNFFLFDIKQLDDKRHIEYTGVSNKVILDNLRLLFSNNKAVMLRIPIIPGYNDDDENLEGLLRLIRSGGSSVQRINLLPFHRIGSSKYSKFGLQYRMGDLQKPAKERMLELKTFFNQAGVKVKIGG
jgi:pyruvate formate lyase activating enzyme